MKPIIHDALEYTYRLKWDEMVRLASQNKISKEDAEDHVQNAFLFWFEHLDRLEELVPKRKPEQIAAVVYKTASRGVLAQIRAEKHPAKQHDERHGGFDGEYGTSDYRYHPEVNLVREDMNYQREAINEIIEKGIAKLGQLDREAVTLVYVEGLSRQDAAKQAGLTPSAFGMRLLRARDRLSRLTMPQIEALELSIDLNPDA